MHLALTAVLAAAALAGTVAAQGACFVPNGTRRDALTNIGNNKYEPCEGNGHSMCCNTATGDKCQANGLCWNEGAKLLWRLWRESCSDPTWQSPKCLKLCVSDDKAPDGDPMSGSDVVVTECADGSYCCGNNNNATECCKSGKGVRIVDGQVVDASSTTSAAPSSTSTSAVTSSAAPSDGGGSNAGVIGGAVGGSLGAVALAAVAGFFWYRRRKRAGSNVEPAPARQDEYVASETKYQNPPYGSHSPAPQYYPPSELPVDGHPAELGGGHPAELGGESIPPTNQR